MRSFAVRLLLSLYLNAFSAFRPEGKNFVLGNMQKFHPGLQADFSPSPK
jgi:hypothetical protein